MDSAISEDGPSTNKEANESEDDEKRHLVEDIIDNDDAAIESPTGARRPEKSQAIDAAALDKTAYPRSTMQSLHQNVPDPKKFQMTMQ
jgi:hypothetical protein